jgi:cell division protein FtsA
MGNRPELVVGLDVGTARVAAVVADPLPGGQIAVVGVGTARCDGLRKGMVVNIEATVQAIASAVKEAEVSAGCEIHNVVASVGGKHIKGFNSHGVVAVRAREVSHADVERVLEAARAVALPPAQDMLHALPQEFVVDGQDSIREPIGMVGVRLEARLHIVSTAKTAAQNVIKCCQRSGLHVADLVFPPIAASEVVLTPEEKESGIALIDIGAGTTGVLVFARGAVRHTAAMPIGGNHVSSDIAAGLRTPFSEAELLKRRSGIALLEKVEDEQTIEVQSVGTSESRLLPRRMLAEIVESRVEEILALAQGQLIRSGLETNLPAGIVLTGGGVLLEGTVALAERVFRMPVRIGAPIGCEGLDESMSGPAFVAAIGLARYGAHPHDHVPALLDEADLFGRIRRRMAGWLREFM